MLAGLPQSPKRYNPTKYYDKAWLLLGQVGAEASDSFLRLRTEMQSKVALLLGAWGDTGVTPRTTGMEFAASVWATTDGTSRDATPVVIP